MLTAMAFAISFTTDNVALDYMFKIGRYETRHKFIGHVNIAHAYVAPIAFANR